LIHSSIAAKALSITWIISISIVFNNLAFASSGNEEEDSELNAIHSRPTKLEVYENNDYGIKF
jgi:hypothetical protein